MGNDDLDMTPSMDVVEKHRAEVYAKVRRIMCEDDCLAHLVPSDLRALIGAIDRLRSERDSAFERAAKVADEKCEFVLSKQTPADALDFRDTVNCNLRMMALLLPEIASSIRSLKGT